MTSASGTVYFWLSVSKHWMKIRVQPLSDLKSSRLFHTVHAALAMIFQHQ